MRYHIRQNWVAVFPAMTIAIILLVPTADAQTGVTLQNQLDAQYKVAKMAGWGAVVVEPGTILVVQRPGIKAMPFRAIPKCPAKFADNTLRMATGFFCTSPMALQDYFQRGNRVYPLKIEVNPAKAKIIFRVVSCDECNGINPPLGLKGDVEFEFPKGYLETASAASVEGTIAQVFSNSNDDPQQAQANAQDPGQQAGFASQQAGDQQQAANEQMPPQQEQAEPQVVQLGMTTDQVQSTLGKPDKVFDLGAKQIYVYRDAKVTFMNGKVSDVQ